jgi:hypothetical protein
VTISLTIAIIAGVALLVLIAGLIIWNIYIMLRIKNFTRIPIRAPSERIDIDFNVWHPIQMIEPKSNAHSYA